jgi:hypothetical protein
MDGARKVLIFVAVYVGNLPSNKNLILPHEKIKACDKVPLNLKISMSESALSWGRCADTVSLQAS